MRGARLRRAVRLFHAARYPVLPALAGRTDHAASAKSTRNSVSHCIGMISVRASSTSSLGYFLAILSRRATTNWIPLEVVPASPECGGPPRRPCLPGELRTPPPPSVSTCPHARVRQVSPSARPATVLLWPGPAGLVVASARRMSVLPIAIPRELPPSMAATSPTLSPSQRTRSQLNSRTCIISSRA